jgi:hypothetical protein
MEQPLHHIILFWFTDDTVSLLYKTRFYRKKVIEMSDYFSKHNKKISFSSENIERKQKWAMNSSDLQMT